MRRSLFALALALSLPIPTPAAETPRVLWEGRPVRAPAAPPALSGDTLWVVGSERRLVSMDARTGKRQWRRMLRATACVRPVPVGDRLLVGLGDLEPSLTALDRRNGHEIWTQRLTAEPITILVRKETAIVVDAGGGIAAFALTDGSSRWKRETGRRLAGAALGESTVCVLARRDSVWLLDPASGTTRTARTISGIKPAAPVASENRFLFSRYDGTIVSIAATTGTATDSVAGPAPQIASGAIHGNQCVSASTGGEVACYRLPDLALEWSRPTGETISTGALFWNDAWIVLTEKGRVLGLSMDRGQPAWSLQFPNPISTPGTCSDRLLVLVDNRGRVVVHAIDGTP